MSDMPPIGFRWEPGPDRKAAFDSLVVDGKWVCPWPDCDWSSSAPQGIARHMITAHGWVSPWSHQHSKRPKATPKRPTYPSEEKRREKVICPVPDCGREINQGYVRQHLRDFHRYSGSKIKRIVDAEAGTQQKPLTAQEICQTVLAEVAPNGSIPIEAIPAFNEWVYATETFLGRLMS